MTTTPRTLEGVSRSSETLRNLALARGTLDRAAVRRKDPELLPSLLKDPSTQVLELAGGRVEVVELDGDLALLLRSPTELDTSRLAVFLGQDGHGTAYVGVVRDDLDPLESSQWRTLREVGVLLSDRDAGLFATMQGLANWHTTHTHCPRCGARTHLDQSGWIRRCPRDESEHFPRTDPAVIMAVTDDADRLLLARSPRWPQGRLLSLIHI